MIIGVVIGAAVALPIMGNNAQTQQTEQQGGQQLPGQKDGENETTPNEGGGAVQKPCDGGNAGGQWHPRQSRRLTAAPP